MYENDTFTEEEIDKMIFGEAKAEPKEQPQEQKTISSKVVPDYRIVGEAFNCYVIVELGDIMYLIDKHAAHERIIFEELKEKTYAQAPSSQILLVPIEVYLSNEEIGSASIWQE